jgi:hypothetical protein
MFFAEKKQVVGLVIRRSSRHSWTGVRGVAGCPFIGISVIGVLEYFAAATILDLAVLLILVIVSFCIFVFGVLYTGRKGQFVTNR